MERLNEILSRSTPQAQRRQRAPEQRPRTRTGQGQRADQLPQPQGDALERSQRPPLPEQTANLGRPIAPAPHRYIQPGQYNPPPGPFAMQGEPLPLEEDAWPAYPRRPPSPRDSLYTPASDYYQADAYASVNRADVVEEWEDDVPSMRYGDWESDEQEMQAYPHPETETAYAANHSLIMRELPSSLEARSYPLPPPRALPMPPPMPQPLPQEAQPGVVDPRFIEGSRFIAPAFDPPMSQPLPQEVQHYQQRTTQPLHPRSPLRMSQDMPPERPPAQVARPTRQLIPSEQARQSIPAPYTASTQVCKICKGAGYLRADVPFGHPNFGRPIACECKETERKEKRRWQLQEISNLGDLKHKSFENFRPNVSKAVYEAYHIALDYARDPQGWLIFIGRNGCGKTHLAAAIANRCLSRGSLVLFSTVIDLLEHLRATFVPTSTEVYDQLFAKMREAELLILDDLGAQQSSPWANEKLFQLLNYRYNSQFPTIITTNNPDLQGIEERIRSRMTDASLVITVSFDSTQDYRPRNPRRR
jgi:DNA replication protein DnaC